MKEKTNGLSLDMIIHPGETLRELLDDREMSQKDLAERTGFSEKQISKIVNGLASISPNFSKKLEYVFGVSAIFWLNLQANYDEERAEFEEKNNITPNELDAFNHLGKIVKYLQGTKVISDNEDKTVKILELRRFLEVANLTVIPSLSICAAFRGSTSCHVDVYVLYAWQKICEQETKDQICTPELNKDVLLASIPEIKELIISSQQDFQDRLVKIFNRCGIAFSIVQHFTGAPIQGFIKKSNDNRIILCMTIRRGDKDIFWFTLFHEIAHILHGDYNNAFFDFTFTENEIEDRANDFASETLISSYDYQSFLRAKNFSQIAIDAFATRINIPSYIVVGRLQKEGILPYNFCRKPKFIWRQ